MKDYFGYQGKTVVVTGASSGMGKAAAAMLVDLGAKVYALSRSKPDVPGIYEFISTDLSDRAAIDKAFAAIPDHIDCFFGIAGASGLHNTFIETVTIDLLSNKYITEEYLCDRMTKGGAIAYMTSNGGYGWELEGNKNHYVELLDIKGWDEFLAALEATPLSKASGNLGYAYSKLALNYLVAKYQEVFAPRGIRVNAVLPGSTDTGLIDDFAVMTGGRDNLLKYTGYAQRLAVPEEMGAPIVFLNSDMASYISGVHLMVDYGNMVGVTAGLKENPNGAFTFDMIVQHMLSRMDK
ncbi:MAG: SDR family oxidoreductase [Mogibacterium sp.]|nr:SDR family oxidoreductase [Mogibacterium sp.]